MPGVGELNQELESGKSRLSLERFASKGDATAAAVVLMRSSDTLPGAAGRGLRWHPD